MGDADVVGMALGDIEDWAEQFAETAPARHQQIMAGCAAVRGYAQQAVFDTAHLEEE